MRIKQNFCQKRELSLYGGEEAFLAPEEVISKKDAKDATLRAEKTYGLCEKLVLEIEKKQVNHDTMISIVRFLYFVAQY